MPEENRAQAEPDAREKAQRLSAKASRSNGEPLTEAEIEAAEAEAEAWVRRVNTC